MSVHRFNYLFHQYVNKAATAEETDEFLSMVRQGIDKQEIQHLLEGLWYSPFSIEPLGETKREQLFNQIMLAAQAEKPGTHNKKYRSSWLKVAAAIVFFIGFTVLFYQLWFQPSGHEVKQVALKKSSQSYRPERRFINLPDGSSVIQNQHCLLEISEQFGLNGKREVYLIEGEAYFDVTHDASSPFIVHTGKLQTTVLGTAFNIKANAGNGTVTITVTRGKVKVGDDAHTFNVVDPDEQVIFKKDLTPVAKKTINAKRVIAWKNEDIFFDDVNIQNVAKQLQERFGVDIVFANEAIRNCRFSATFFKSQTLDQILTVIGEFNHIRYQYIDKETVLLDGKGCG